jgi:hypothetical protein
MLLQWLKDRHDMRRNPDDASGADVAVRAHIRLAERANQNLDWWAEDLKVYGLENERTRQIQLDWLHAKHLVNSVCAKNVYGMPKAEALKELSRVLAIDSAVQLLQRCASWSPAEALTLLPHVYYRVSRVSCDIHKADGR